MDSLPSEKLDQLISRWKDIQAQLNEGVAQERYSDLTKEYSHLGPIVDTIHQLRGAEQESADLRDLLEESGLDEELEQLAKADLSQLRPRIQKLRQDLRLALLPRDLADDRSVILEIRAGTGGDEAALFAADLFQMYIRYSDTHKWKSEIISVSENSLKGYREIIASIRGRGVFARMKFESGVHRVQRIPVTETGGRIHTSAATVAVLPEAEEIDISISPEDIRIDTMRAAGAGGQHVNTTDSAVRITHLPTGICVVSSEKSQHQNRRLAMQVLRSRIYELERQKAAQQRAQIRKTQVGSGDRSQRVRTYNYPQGRVTDHRINLTLHKLEQILEGSCLDEIITPLIADHQASLMAAVEVPGE